MIFIEKQKYDSFQIVFGHTIKQVFFFLMAHFQKLK